MNGAMQQLYGRRVPDIEAAAVAGAPAHCAAEVAEVAAAGAELILFTTMFDQAEQAARLATEVIPRLG
jgi:alkanesulfonate monooxygenase SsuD/methylene tetrahydromethanopterin reductase-like flavin-dependent oxidoreductase (luciferase family)